MPFPEQGEGSGFDVIEGFTMLQPEVGIEVRRACILGYGG